MLATSVSPSRVTQSTATYVSQDSPASPSRFRSSPLSLFLFITHRHGCPGHALILLGKLPDYLEPWQALDNCGPWRRERQGLSGIWITEAVLGTSSGPSCFLGQFVTRRRASTCEHGDCVCVCVCMCVMHWREPADGGVRCGPPGVWWEHSRMGARESSHLEPCAPARWQAIQDRKDRQESPALQGQS